MIFIQLLLVATVLALNEGLHRRMIAESSGDVPSSPVDNTTNSEQRNNEINDSDTDNFSDSDFVVDFGSDPDADWHVVQSSDLKQDSPYMADHFRFAHLSKAKLKYEADQFRFVRSLPKNIGSKSEQMLLPFARKDSKNLTLVVDLDETLIHCSVNSFYRTRNDLFFFDGTWNFYCIFRPQYKEFLKLASERYEVIVFSNSPQIYSDLVLDVLDPEKKFITYRLYRQHCKLLKGHFVKDISYLGRPLSSVVALDNSYVAFAYNLDNLMPIIGFIDNKKDRELLKSLEAIQIMGNADVLESLNQMFQLHNRIYGFRAIKNNQDANSDIATDSVNDQKTQSIETSDFPSDENDSASLPTFKGRFSIGRLKMANALFVSDSEAQSQYEERQFAFIRSLPETITNESDLVVLLNFRKDFSKRLTLIVDVDETLVHCSKSAISSYRKHDLKFPMDDEQRYCFFRPEARQFLKLASAKFEVISFTAAKKTYADHILDALDPTNEYITERLYRQHATYVNGIYCKDINHLGRPLSNVIALDNSFVAFAYSLENLMPITNFYDDENDLELMKSLRIIESIDTSNDLRSTLRSMFQVRNRIFGATSNV